ncbi:MAG: HAMP domain-containing histidine kinase, partial [Rectinema sp.]|nr:HAMP domain-containing histidine kinase [Rectinema sp.]
MKLRTQFLILTLAVTLFPILFGLIVFAGFQNKRDPRVPTREFLEEAAHMWSENQNLTIEMIRMAGEKAQLPLVDAALVGADGTVLVSSFRDIPAGSKLMISDLAKYPLAAPGRPRPEIRILPVNTRDAQNPLIIFDIQPFWTREDIRTRNFMLISGFTLGTFLVAGILSLLLLRSTSKAIRKLIQDTAVVAEGNLNHEVTGSGAQELRFLAESINRMRVSLRDMIVRRKNMLIGVSHDLKTPIALIQGYSDALADNMAVDEEARLRYIEIIREKSTQLEELVSDLIEYLKLDDQQVRMEEVDPVEFVTSMGKRFEEDARLMGMRFECRFGTAITTPVQGHYRPVRMNRILIERALENLVSNSLRYMGAGGTVRLQLDRQGDFWLLSVSDTGPGVPEAELPYIFDAFYRGSPSR